MKGEASVADVELECVKGGVWVGCRCAYGARENNLMNWLREMASASELVLPGRCCIVMVKWCCAANINRVCVRFMVRVPGVLALSHKDSHLIVIHEFYPFSLPLVPPCQSCWGP